MMLHPGMELDVREHAFLLASNHIAYSFVRVKGLRTILFGGQGMFMDQFVTTSSPGCWYCMGTATSSSADWKRVKAFSWSRARSFYKDSSVTMAVETVSLSSGFFSAAGMMYLARDDGTGPAGHPVDVPSPGHGVRGHSE